MWNNFSEIFNGYSTRSVASKIDHIREPWSLIFMYHYDVDRDLMLIEKARFPQKKKDLGKNCIRTSHYTMILRILVQPPRWGVFHTAHTSIISNRSTKLMSSTGVSNGSTKHACPSVRHTTEKKFSCVLLLVKSSYYSPNTKKHHGGI